MSAQKYDSDEWKNTVETVCLLRVKCKSKLGSISYVGQSCHNGWQLVQGKTFSYLWARLTVVV